MKTLRLLGAIGLLVLIPLGAQGETSPPQEPAPLVVYNRHVFTFRAPMLGYSAADRAAAAQGRIESALARPGASGAITTQPAAEGVYVRIDGQNVMLVQGGDVDRLAEDTVEQLAERTRAKLQDAATAVIASRGVLFWIQTTAFAAVITAFWLLLLFALVRARRWGAARATAMIEKHAERLKVSGVSAVHPVPLATLTRKAVAIAAWGAGLLATNVWLTLVLERFPYTAPWGRQLEGYLVGVLVQFATAIANAVPGLLIVAMIVVVTRALQRMGDAFFNRVQAGEVQVGWLDSETVRPTRRIAGSVLWLFALAMAYPYLPGANTEAFKGLTVLIGLMISLGGASVVGQLLSGISLMYQRVIRVGEYVRIGEIEGTVVAVGLMRTTIHTGMGEEVSVPNSSIVVDSVRNFSRLLPGHGFVVSTGVTIGYDTPWRQVHALLLEAAARTPGILSDPAPYVVQTALSDFYVEYKLVARAGPDAPRLRAEAISALHATIQDVFNEYGVQIMSPQYYEDPEIPKVVPKDKWFEAPAVNPAKAP